MDKAKAAVKSFIHKDGHHDTTVHERIAPAVVQERIEKQQHEEIQPVVDREVHVDHYHTTVQPIVDRAVLPEQHVVKSAPVSERVVGGVNEREISERLQREAAQFKDVRVEGGTSVTRSSNPTLVGEHKHHHVHEVIQPVIQKETIQPIVVHTTVPVHEVVHDAPKIHSTSTLPPVTMGEYKHQGGVLSGRDERLDGFEGEPRTIGTAINSVTDHSSRTGHHNPLSGTHGTTGITGTGHHNPLTGTHGTTGITGTGHHNPLTGTHGTTGIGTGHNNPLTGSNTMGTTGHNSMTGHNTTSSSTTGHPTMREKLDPRVDADGDGRPGVMS